MTVLRFTRELLGIEEVFYLRVRTMTLFLILTFVLTACSNGYLNASKNTIAITPQQAGSGEIVDLIAENWSFNEEKYIVPAGEVTINLINIEGFHGIEVQGTDISIEGDGSYTTVLEPGEYTIVCNIICGTGHYDMVAKLIVEEG